MKNEWLDIVYSGFWDFPFAFVVSFNGNSYLFRRGYFNGELDDYPSEDEVIRINDSEF